MNSLVNIWWVFIPRLLRRVAITPAAASTDGLYITTLPQAAAFLPPLVFFAGLLFGWLHLGYRNAFSESLPLLIITALIGILSANLGLMFLAGFVLGDYFLFNPGWMLEKNVLTVFFYRFSLVIEYVLLAGLLVQTPLLTKTLLGQFYGVLRFGRAVSLIFAVLGHLVLSVVLVFLWAQTVPVLIRPVFTWAGGSPPVDAMENLQRGYLWLILAVTAIASITRMVLQARSAFSPDLSERIGALEDAASEGEIVPLTERFPAAIRAVFIGVFSAFLMSGLYWDWIDSILVFLIVTALQLVRLRVLPVPVLPVWSRWMDKIPLLIRLGAGSAIVFGVSYYVLPSFWNESFRPMLFLIIFAIVVYYLLNPGISPPEKGPEEQQAV